LRVAVLDYRHTAKAALLEALARDLGLPGHAARNLDALAESLVRDVPGPVVIHWRVAPAGRQALGADHGRLLHTLLATSRLRRDLDLVIG